jgi:hypothetical protein
VNTHPLTLSQTSVVHAFLSSQILAFLVQLHFLEVGSAMHATFSQASAATQFFLHWLKHGLQSLLLIKTALQVLVVSSQIASWHLSARVLSEAHVAQSALTLQIGVSHPMIVLSKVKTHPLTTSQESLVHLFLSSQTFLEKSHLSLLVILS